MVLPTGFVHITGNVQDCLAMSINEKSLQDFS